MTDLLHHFARGLEEVCRGPGESEAQPFHCLDNFQARAIFIPGAVAQVDKDIEAASRKLDDLTNTFRLVDVGGFAFVALEMTRHI